MGLLFKTYYTCLSVYSVHYTSVHYNIQFIKCLIVLWDFWLGQHPHPQHTYYVPQFNPIYNYVHVFLHLVNISLKLCRNLSNI